MQTLEDRTPLKVGTWPFIPVLMLVIMTSLVRQAGIATASIRELGVRFPPKPETYDPNP